MSYSVSSTALELGRSVGEMSAVLMWNGATFKQIRTYCRSEARQLKPFERAMYLRELNHWINKTKQKILDCKAVKSGAAIKGENIAAIFSDGQFMFMPREKALDYAETSPVVKNMLSILSVVSKSAYAEVSA